jgi:predicted DNA-binding antitoxin AbrB/MazE fold protein
MNSQILLNTFQVIYDDGILRPLKPLKFQKGHIIRIQIIPESTDSEIMQTLKFLEDKNLIKPPPKKVINKHIPIERRQRMSKILGAASNNRLSEHVIEDRGIY